MEGDAGCAEILHAQTRCEHVLARPVHHEDLPCRQLRARCARWAARRRVQGEQLLEGSALLVPQRRCSHSRARCSLQANLRVSISEPYDAGGASEA